MRATDLRGRAVPNMVLPGGATKSMEGEGEKQWLRVAGSRGRLEMNGCSSAHLAKCDNERMGWRGSSG